MYQHRAQPGLRRDNPHRRGADDRHPLRTDNQAELDEACRNAHGSATFGGVGENMRAQCTSPSLVGREYPPLTFVLLHYVLRFTRINTNEIQITGAN